MGNKPASWLLHYYFDEHFDAAVVDGLRARGIKVLTTREAGLAGKRTADQSQLAYASAGGWVLVTQDRDFIELVHVGLNKFVVYRHSRLWR